MKKYLEKEGKRHLNVSGVLRELGVSRSGYTAWVNGKISNSKKRKNRIKNRIEEIHKDSKGVYGAPKITRELRKEGECISEKTTGNYMREMSIRACWTSKYTNTTINPDFSKKYKNILNREFNPDKPDAVWVSDITYINTKEGFVYLTSIMDLYSRKIISWVLSNSLETKHIVKAVEEAKANRNISNPLILHSDRGTQYTSKDYSKVTKEFTTSYSDKGNPWDNACIESFHALLKREWTNRFKIENYIHAKSIIFEYIETFYNTVRIHSHCNYLSPNEYEEMYNKRLKEMEIKVA